MACWAPILLIRNGVVFTISLFFIEYSLMLPGCGRLPHASPELLPEGDPIPSASVEATGRDEGACFPVLLFAPHSRLSD
jgi:hypothetical protein